MRNFFAFLSFIIVSAAFSNIYAVTVKTILNTHKKINSSRHTAGFDGLYKIPVSSPKLKDAKTQADKDWSLLEGYSKDLHINPHGEKALIYNCGTGFFTHALAKKGTRPTSISKSADVTKLSKQISAYNKISDFSSPPEERGTCFKTVTTTHGFLKRIKPGQFHSAYIPQNIADSLVAHNGLSADLALLKGKMRYIVILSSAPLKAADYKNDWLCQKTHVPTARYQGKQPYITFLIPKTVTVGKKTFTTEKFIQFDGGATCYLCKGGNFVKFFSTKASASKETKKELDFYKAANKNKKIRSVPKCKAVQASKKKASAIALSTVPGQSLNYISKLSNAEKAYIFYKVCQIAAQFDRARICHTGIINRNVMYDKKSKKVSLVDFEKTSIGQEQSTSSLLKFCWEISHHGQTLSQLSKGFKRKHRKANLYGIFAPIARKIMASNATTPKDLCADAKKLMNKHKK